MTVELLVRALTETASIQSESFPGIFNTPSGRLSQTQSTPKFSKRRFVTSMRL